MLVSKLPHRKVYTNIKVIMLSISTMIKLGVQSNVTATFNTCWQKNGAMDVVVESMSHTDLI